ncbi:four helix bundle protein [Chryseobacterium sp. SNU WT5]|uniref:four helix bundle protein n=1 Tax=Chryseobacterium sp. SNU WT5 TaxID=2594269 RepID=UPI001E2A7D7A|nr:four helix bundle protein [Chryseobacterium sp. SNU WT5]
MSYGEKIFQISSDFPKNEAFNLTSQIRRAPDFIALNIAEGSILQSNPEYKKFPEYSIRTLAEAVTCLYKAKYRTISQKNNF